MTIWNSVTIKLDCAKSGPKPLAVCHFCFGNCFVPQVTQNNFSQFWSITSAKNGENVLCHIWLKGHLSPYIKMHQRWYDFLPFCLNNHMYQKLLCYFCLIGERCARSGFLPLLFDRPHILYNVNSANFGTSHQPNMVQSVLCHIWLKGYIL